MTVAPVRARAGRGLLAGLANQTRREAASWWSNGRWYRQALIWAGLLVGLFALMHWVLPAVVPAEAGLPDSTLAQSIGQFTELVAIVTAIGVVLLTQSIVIDERRNGVLEWLLSKPLARPALLVAKFAGQAAGLLVTAVALPWLAVFVVLGVATGEPWPPGRTLTAAGMIGLLVVFHLALVLATSTITWSRVAVLAVPLVLIVGADLITAVAPWAFELLPWSLGPVAGAWLAQGVLVTGWPVAATVGWTLALLGIASWRLHHTEL